jgi:plasmid stabilization system protein ParE
LIAFTDEALADIDRMEAVSSGASLLIEKAVSVLEDNPYVGRAVDEYLRELIISRGKTGYVALYLFDQANEDVVIVAVRHQRESGYWLS